MMNDAGITDGLVWEVSFWMNLERPPKLNLTLHTHRYTSPRDWTGGSVVEAIKRRFYDGWHDVHEIELIGDFHGRLQ